MSRSAANADIFQAIAGRLVAPCSISSGREQPVKQLAQPFDMFYLPSSQHLQVLCDVELVNHQQVGRQRLYIYTNLN